MDIIESLRILTLQPTLSPRPWELIFDTQGVKHLDGSPAPGTAPITNSFRILDANGCLLIRIQADPEQTLKAEDMQLIVTAVNALPEFLKM